MLLVFTLCTPVFQSYIIIWVACGSKVIFWAYGVVVGIKMYLFIFIFFWKFPNFINFVKLKVLFVAHWTVSLGQKLLIFIMLFPLRVHRSISYYRAVVAFRYSSLYTWLSAKSKFSNRLMIAYNQICFTWRFFYMKFTWF